MPPRLEDGLRDGQVPGDRGRSGDGHQPGLIQRPGLRLAAGARTMGAAARRDRTLPTVTLSDTGVRGERAHCRRQARQAAAEVAVRRPCRNGDMHAAGLIVLLLRDRQGWVKVVVTAPAGHVGSRVVRLLIQAGYGQRCSPATRPGLTGPPASARTWLKPIWVCRGGGAGDPGCGRVVLGGAADR